MASGCINQNALVHAMRQRWRERVQNAVAPLQRPVRDATAIPVTKSVSPIVANARSPPIGWIMARRTQTYAVRLAVEGGGQVKAELGSVGQSGEQSLKAH
jgi:hypothetical protein